jgi:hypothetical protein
MSVSRTLALRSFHTSFCHLECPVQGKIGSKDPFAQYGGVRGLKVHYGSTTDYSTYPEGPFDVVYDNNGKDMDSCKMLIDAAKVTRPG